MARFLVVSSKSASRLLIMSTVARNSYRGNKAFGVSSSRESCVNNRHICFVYRTYFIQRAWFRKNAGWMQAITRGHSSFCLRFVFLLIHPHNCNCAHSMREKFRGLKQTTFNLILQLSVSLFYLPACVDNINSINNATPLVVLDWNAVNIKWRLQKDTRSRKSRKLK